MIIDTTCSVIERTMKEAAEELVFTFKIGDSTIDTNNITFTTGSTIVFDCGNNVIYNDSVTFMISGSGVWNNMSKMKYWHIL